MRDESGSRGTSTYASATGPVTSGLVGLWCATMVRQRNACDGPFSDTARRTQTRRGTLDRWPTAWPAPTRAHVNSAWCLNAGARLAPLAVRSGPAATSPDRPAHSVSTASVWPAREWPMTEKTERFDNGQSSCRRPLPKRLTPRDPGATRCILPRRRTRNDHRNPSARRVLPTPRRRHARPFPDRMTRLVPEIYYHNGRRCPAAISPPRVHGGRHQEFPIPPQNWK
jgi:hypothetical protein